eukprot:symbB.v1.2.005202.t1/scaffold299.1/size236002/14
MGWAKELAHDEVSIRQHMDGKVAKNLQGKRLLLLEKIAGDIGWPDVGLHAELRDGFKITGYAKPCGVFKREVKIATMDKEHLMQESKYLRPALLGKAKSTATSDEDTKKLFEITCNEAGEKSWLEGLELHLLWFNYFDDFPCATFVEQRKSTLGSVRTLFDILGFRFAEDKLAPFDRRAEMLGVEVDLTHLLSDRVIVDNKTSRKEELCNAIEQILSDGCIIPSSIPSLLGRLQFADLQLMGRTGKLAMADIREMMTSSDKSVPLQPDVISALEVLQSRMSCGEPRTLHIDKPKAPVVVFTDGAFEPSGDGTFSATVGGVLIPRDGPVRVFGCRVNPKVVDRWLQVLVHPIGLIELYAIGVAFKTSSTTAISRANAILRYLRWSGEHNEEQDPQTEASGWSYVKFLEQTGAAATTGSRWLSAVRYAVYIFGYKNMECICNSRRIQGKCDVMYVEKDDLNQAAPFTVSQVKELHRKISDDNIDVYDKAFIAFILTSIYTRSRHSDFRYISKVILDVDDRGGFVETRTRHHKTARSALKKTVLLPIIAPARGVDGSIWVHDVAKAFADIGLPFEDCTNNPLFRPVGADGTLCKRGVTSSETNKFLELLFPDDTSAIYSRDLSVKSVTALQKVIDAIHEGSFKPDETRKGYFQNDVIEIPPEVSVGYTSAKVENIEIKDDDSECVNLVSVHSHRGLIMASLIESEAQFHHRMKDLKISDPMQAKIIGAGFSTFGVLAYAHGQPGQAIVDSAFETWVSTNLDSAASLADISCIKRLLFESQTLVLASLKEQVTGLSSETSVKKLPSAERETRLNVVRKQLTGLLIEGALEPAHCLIDLCASMQQSNEIKYVSPERSVSRVHEIMSQKNPTKQLDIAADTLVIKEHREVPDAIAHSAMQVHESFVRRGIALLCADVVSHDKYTKYISTLFNHMHRDPPPGYSRCTVSQIVAADKAVWQKLLEDNIKPRRQADGSLQLDDSL